MLLEEAKYSLLARMVEKRCRTPQIKACTGYGDRKIREQYESQLGVKGKSGRQCTSQEFFLKPQRALHSSIIAAKLIDMDLHKQSLTSVEGGHALCDAHDAYLLEAYGPGGIPSDPADQQISAENAWILSANFLRTGFLALQPCKQCSAPYLKRVPLNVDACPFCVQIRNVARICRHCRGPQDEHRHCLSLECRRKRDRARQGQQQSHMLAIPFTL